MTSSCRFLVMFLLSSLIGSAAIAQDRPDRPWSRGGRAPSSEVRLEALDLVAAIGVECHLGMAQLRGNDQDGIKQYEITCTNGPGYLLIRGKEPAAYNCLALEASFRASGLEAARCRIRANRNARPVVIRLAAEAGIACRVDDGLVVGKSTGDGLLYEVGCAGADGYWLERTGDDWSATPCLKVIAQGGQCTLTTNAEQAASLGARLSSAADCEVVEAAFRGSSEGTDLYEIRCRSGTGLIVRFDPSDRLLDVYTCGEATHIGGGCRLGQD